MKELKQHTCGFSEATLSNIRKFQRKYQTQSPVISSSPSQVSLKIGVLKNFAYITGQHRCCSLFLIKLIKFFIKKRLQHKSFPVTFAKFLRTPFFTEHLQWLLVDGACGIGHLIGDWIACFLCHLAIDVLGQFDVNNNILMQIILIQRILHLLDLYVLCPTSLCSKINNKRISLTELMARGI